jgi:hypothetical protein
LKLTSHSKIRTGLSLRSVRLSGVFVDAGGSVKGLTVLRVLPGAEPTDKWLSTSKDFLQKVYCGERAEVGILDPFWWQSREVADVYGQARVSVTGGAMTCLFTLAKGVKLDDERWLKGQARIAAPAACVDMPVRLAEGREVGVIVDELNHLPLGGHPVYPLLKLRRSQADRATDVGIRNGAMVFTQNGDMVGVIVATFGAGEYYSVAPLEDVMEWHALSFIAEPMQGETRATEKLENVKEAKRPIAGSEEILQLCGA